MIYVKVLKCLLKMLKQRSIHCCEVAKKSSVSSHRYSEICYLFTRQWDDMSGLYHLPESMCVFIKAAWGYNSQGNFFFSVKNCMKTSIPPPSQVISFEKAFWWKMPCSALLCVNSRRTGAWFFQYFLVGESILHGQSLFAVYWPLGLCTSTELHGCCGPCRIGVFSGILEFSFM